MEEKRRLWKLYLLVFAISTPYWLFLFHIFGRAHNPPNTDNAPAIVEGESNMEINLVTNIIIPIAVSGASSVAVYLFALRKLPDKIFEKLHQKMDPSNSVLHDDHEHIRSAAERFHNESGKAQVALAKDIGALVKRSEERDAAYKNLDANQKSVVDAVGRLNVFSDLLQEVVQQNNQLRQENDHLKHEIELLRVQHFQNKPRSHNNDYGMEL